MLVDPGSTHSYVSSFFASRFDEPAVLLNYPFWVSTSTKRALLIQLIFKSYVVSTNGMDTLANLMLLEIVDFDVILGIDWLASCHATVDYHTKVVKFEILDGPSFIFRGNSCLTLVTLISSLVTLRLMNKGNLGFLALVKNTEDEVLSLDQVPVVREFLDVFPTKLPGMPSEREIEFCVDLIPDTQPISIPSYCMASTELRELKEQSQDLLGKGFIHPSMSQWGAPVLFLKEKNVKFQ